MANSVMQKLLMVPLCMMLSVTATRGEDVECQNCEHDAGGTLMYYCYVEGYGWTQCFFYPEGGTHWFTGECGASLAFDGACSRCGGTSTCHPEPQAGGCHLRCGPGGGDLASTIRDVNDAVFASDAHRLARLVIGDLHVKYAPRTRQIRVVSGCSPEVAATIDIPPAIANAMEAEYLFAE